MTRIGELGTTQAATGNRRKLLVILMMEVLSSPETSVLTRAALRNVPEDAILHTVPPHLPIASAFN
jgi:hypothetical protein